MLSKIPTKNLSHEASINIFIKNIMNYTTENYDQLKENNPFIEIMPQYHMNSLIKKELAQPRDFLSIEDKYHDFIKKYINPNFNQHSNISYNLIGNKEEDYNLILKNIFEEIQYSEIFSNLFERESKPYTNYHFKFKTIPRQTLDSYLGYLTKNSLVRSPEIIEIIKESKHANSAVGYIRGEMYGDRGYFKISDNKNKILKNILISLHAYSTRGAHGITPHIPFTTTKSYYEKNELYFMLMSDNLIPQLQSQPEYQEMIYNKCYKLKFDLSDKITHKMQILATFHSEMKHINLPKGLEKIFDENDFLEFEEILENNDDGDLNQVLGKQENKYCELIKKHMSLEKTTISHNDTKLDNWISQSFTGSSGKPWLFERMIDFDESSWGQEYVDVEKVLFDVKFNDRKKYKKEYIDFREIFENNLGYNYNVNFKEFNELSNERGFISSIRYLSYGENKDFYSKNLEYYIDELKK